MEQEVIITKGMKTKILDNNHVDQMAHFNGVAELVNIFGVN
ncbi:hypothetical protein ACG2LH_08345 [Zhouia sp. PK063]